MSSQALRTGEAKSRLRTRSGVSGQPPVFKGLNDPLDLDFGDRTSASEPRGQRQEFFELIVGQLQHPQIWSG